MASRKPGPPREDDRALWRRVTRDARPLPKRDQRQRDVPADQAPDETPERREETRPSARRPAEAGPGSHAPTAPPPALEKGGLAGVDRRTGDRLRRGRLPVEARLDLHGMTQDEAERALGDFLARSQKAGKRCVLVITGKGGERRADDLARTGVLRRMVPHWLNAPVNRARVLAYDEARPQHGGAGALYVLLKRPR